MVCHFYSNDDTWFRQGLILAPVTSAGVNDIPDELSGAASGVTNTMHQIGGPIGLTLIVFLTNQFQSEMILMAAFTIISIAVVAVFIRYK